MKLPSKKILITIIVCLVVIGIAGFFKQHELASLIGINENAPLTPQQGTSTINLQSRNFYENAVPVTPSTTVTQKFSRDFFLNYVDLQNQGKWDINSQASLIDSLSTAYASSSKPGIKASNIAVFSDLDKDKVRAFGNAVAQTLTKYSANLKDNPIDILADVINKNSTTTLQTRLAPLSRTYRLMAKDLARIKAPASMAATYADIINMYGQIANGIDDTAAYFSDPVRGFLGLNTYRAAYVNEVNLLKNLADYFKSNGILFSNTEAGYVWGSLSQ